MKSGIRPWAAARRPRYNRIKENRTGGFTLVELIVVLVVLGILCSIAVMSIIGWQDYADFKKQNEFAQNIFVAAQTQLTQYGERGQLTALKDEVIAGEKNKPENYLLSRQGILTDDKGNPFEASDDALWQSYVNEEDGVSKGNIYFLKAKKGDYSNIYQPIRGKTAEEMKKLSAEERRIKALFDMLDPYVADKSMLDAAICLEFDPDPKVALVYSVFYDEKVSEFTYGEKGMGDEGKVASIRDRRREARKEDMVGYYGAEMLSRGTDVNIAKPIISNVKLSNGDRLELSWTVDSEEALTGMVYTLNFYSSPDNTGSDGVNVASLLLGDEDSGETLKRQLESGIVKGSYFSSADGWKSKTTMEFPASADLDKKSITVVLDGLDLAMDESVISAEHGEDGKGRYLGSPNMGAGICRLGLDDVDYLYIEITGKRDGVYYLTTLKKSNTEHQYFGKFQKRIAEDGNEVRVYTIENARHLNNVRYYEKIHAKESKNVTYRVTQDIDWNGMIKAGGLYKGMLMIPAESNPEDYRFKPILMLGEHSSLLTEAAEPAHMLKNFSLTMDNRPSLEQEGGNIPDNTVGFVVLNRGTISNLTLDSVTVTGAKNKQNGATGSFCGENKGQLRNLTVRSGSISGNTRVGGITGAITGSGQYESLTNRAFVSGNKYVGGIAGSIIADQGTLTVVNCKNYGIVEGSGEEAFFIGGITGYSVQEGMGSLTISSCASSPAYSGIEALITEIQGGDFHSLTGNYVGGISGFNYNATITDCNTMREDAAQNGYVLGNSFVGGIVGFNAGDAGSSLEGGANNRNQAHIIGMDYVGGITGCNALVGTEILEKIKKADYVIAESDLQASGNAKIKGWLNEGTILAMGSYAGGITGANYGTILDCNSNVDYGNQDGNLVAIPSQANYIGGIAGYNCGIIKSEDGNKISAITAITGNHFVGGIVGYNDLNGEIHDYELKGGYIRGRRFVGGFVGLNTAKSIFSDYIVCKLNEVSGEYFGGGIIGANIMPVSGNETVTARFKTDNFLGSLNLEEGAFAGGFIGYNYLLDAGKADGQSIKQKTLELSRTMEESKASDMEQLAVALQDLDTPLKGFLKGYENTDATMIIQGENTDITQTKLGGISALVYAGGVVGYNQESTRLVIQDVENITPVTANAYIKRQEEGIGNADDTYSFVGGIIGKVSKQVTLIRCSNRDVGEVRTMGTYTGGLAEINYGLIQECAAGNLGSGSEDYIGGLVGVNAATAEGTGLVDCMVTGTIMGGDYVGGMAAVSYGIIKDPILDGCKIEAAGKHVGGIAGYGYKTSSISFTRKNAASLDIDISGTGSCVGGIAGTNEGKIRSAYTITNKEGNRIAGQRHVGGFVGVQADWTEGDTLSNLENRAAVEAETGYAGGIVAWTKKDADKIKISRSRNYGSVEVLSENADIDDIEDMEDDSASAAGGITAVNHGTLSACSNEAQVKAGNGYSAGIAALNYGTIASCRVGGASAADVLELNGDKYVGGITAINKAHGDIRSSSVSRLVLENQTSTEDGAIGGIAAVNEGTVENCTVGVEWEPEEDSAENPAGDYGTWHQDVFSNMAQVVKAAGTGTDDAFTLTRKKDNSEVVGDAVILQSNATGAAVGGVAGINTGKIAGSNHDKDGYSVVLAELKFAGRNMNYYGYLGGIAGINRGTIKRYEFNGLIHGTANNPGNTPEYNPNYDFEVNGSTIYGYGGIAGINGDDKKADVNAVIQNCMVNAARINGIGDANNRTNVGGAVGVNGVDASVTGIQFGDWEEWKEIIERLPKDKAGAWFTETVSSTNFASRQYVGTVRVGTDSYGHAGGVAGYNQGRISNINRYIGDYEKYRETYFPKNLSQNGNSYVDRTGVLVINQTGHTGGIVGYNRRTGAIDHAVTGRRWVVFAPSQGEDNGTGGIIGYNISDRDQEYCDNHGTVVKTIESGGISNSVGGMTGRNENAGSSSWRFYECRNYGDIYGAARAGGMVGHWKYKGGTLENCYNFGNVWANKENVGGMVAMFYGMNAGETVNLIGCRNHGNIGAAGKDIRTGGMVGQVRSDNSKINIRVSDCVNTGLIGGGTSSISAGLLADTNAASLIFLSCRNYGYSWNTNTASNQKFYGLSGSSNRTSMEMKNCFAITDRTIVKNPLIYGAKSTTAGGYYFAKDQGQGSTDRACGNPLYVRKKADGNYMAVNSAQAKIVSELGKLSETDILLLDKTDTRTMDSGLAYDVYKKLDEYLLRGVVEPKLSQPHDIKGQETDGYLQVEWQAEGDVQYYTAECTYYKENPDGTKKQVGTVQKHTAYVNTLRLPTSFSADGVYANMVQIQVQSHAADSSGRLQSSDKSVETPLRFGIQLPVPQVHRELVTLDKDACYRVVLDNREEFQRFVDSQTSGSIKMSDINIYVTKANETAQVFTAEAGELNAWQSGNGNSNILQTCYAATNVRGFSQSPKVIRESRLPKKDNYVQTGNNGRMGLVSLQRMPSMKQVGFFGNAMDILSYKTTLQTTGDWILYYRMELSAFDPKLNVPVVFAVAPQTRTSSTSSGAVQVSLNNLPKDFLNKDETGNYIYGNEITLRAYPTKMSNDVFYQGWQVKFADQTGPWTADELKTLYVDETGRGYLEAKTGSTPLIAGTEVKKGYVIEYLGADSYSVYYNTLVRYMAGADLRNENNWKYTHSSQNAAYMYDQVIYHRFKLSDLLEDKLQPEPVVYANAKYQEDPEHPGQKSWQNGDYDKDNIFTLTWDQAAQNGNPAYQNREGKTPYSPEAEYRLTITGTLPGGKKTIIVNNLTISTSAKDEKGRYNCFEADASKWNYTDIEVTLTRVGTLESDKQHTNMFPATLSDQSFPMRLRLSTIGQPTVELKKVNGVAQKDEMIYTARWEGLKSDVEKDALRYYKVKVTGSVTHKTEETAYIVYTEAGNANQTTAELDLRSFQGEEKISVTVQAIAKIDNTSYRDGIVGTAREMTLPKRLEAPEMGTAEDPNARLKADYAKDVPDVDSFEAGCMTLRMSADQYSGEAGVQFQIALLLYETEAEANDPKGVPIAIDNLPLKDNLKRTYMERDSASDQHTFVVKGIPAKYAGKWLRVILRAVSSSNISSVWTEDDTDGANNDTGHKKVIPYRVFQLPKAQVNPVSLPESADVEEIKYLVRKNGVEDPMLQMIAKQETLAFTTADYADDYNMVLIQLPQSADKMAMPSDNLDVSDVSWLELKKKSDGVYTLVYESTEAAFHSNVVQKPLEIIVGGTQVELPYEKTLYLESSEDVYSILLKSYLRAEMIPASEGKEASVLFTLTVPDYTELYDDNGDTPPLVDDTNEWTEQLLFQSVAADRERYVDSLWAVMAREEDSLEKQPNPIKMDAEILEPDSVATEAAAVLDKRGISYQIGGGGTDSIIGLTRYLVSVEQDGIRQGLFAVPFEEAINIASKVWLPERFAAEQYQGKTVTLRFLSIFNVGSTQGGGLSKWSEQTYQVALPVIPPVEAASLNQTVSDSILYSTIGKNNARSIGGKELEIRQYQVKWIYRFAEDAKIGGYDVVIQSRNERTDCHLKLDLRQNELGKFPGLREYMTEEGKLLYFVAYDLEGDDQLTEGTGTASPSDWTLASGSDWMLASDSNWAGEVYADVASPSNLQAGTVQIGCRLKAEYSSDDDGILFTLTLPDAYSGFWKGTEANRYRDIYEDGMYRTERILVTPLPLNEYYTVPEPEWLYLEKSLMETLREGSDDAESDSWDGDLIDDLTE